MIRLSAFADEISADLDEQIAVLRSENINYLDLRGVWGTNVLDLTDQQAAEIKRGLDAHKISSPEIRNGGYRIRFRVNLDNRARNRQRPDGSIAGKLHLTDLPPHAFPQRRHVFPASCVSVPDSDSVCRAHPQPSSAVPKRRPR